MNLQAQRIELLRNRLQRAINHTFANPRLLAEALRHPTYAEEHRADGPHNQRLEFLGDAILKMVLSDLLFTLFPHAAEGTLTQHCSALCHDRFLASLGREIRIGDCMQIGRGEEAQGGRTKDKVLEDAFEALIGAVYLDGGLDAARKFISRVFGDIKVRLASVQQSVRVVNPIGRLQEWAQQALPGNPIPVYQEVKRTGPDHRPEFTFSVAINGQIQGLGVANSSRDAKAEAALDALRSLDVI